ncbi:MAG: hypothetical protein WBX30_19625 [Stellaceae bacterium]
MPAQRAADDLLAQQLRAESPDAENVGHGVRVPALGQHRHRDDAADALAEAAGFADRVHDLAQKILGADLLAGMVVAGALNEIAPEALDLIRCHCAEVLVECVAGFELFAVDQQGARPGEPFAILIVIAEQLEAALDPDAIALTDKAGDEVVDEL